MASLQVGNTLRLAWAEISTYMINSLDDGD